VSADSSNHWNAFYQRWKGLPPPLRPHADVVCAIRENLPAGGDPVLLLGVTPELATIAPNLLAVDRSEMMIAKVWPGNAAGCRVRRDDWLTMELPPHSFAAAIGDGSLNAVTYPDGQEQVYRQLLRFVKPGGRLLFRVYLTPWPGETIDQVAATAWNKAQGTFHAFKWRLMMALVARSGVANVAVADVRELFISLFPDRLKLAAASGWSEADIDSIDVYKDSTEVYSFPTERQFLSLVPKTIRHVKLMPAGTYELAGRCPIAVMSLPE
jgi:SAM-dependent methyltransferase